MSPVNQSPNRTGPRDFHEALEAQQDEIARLACPDSRVCRRCIDDDYLWASVAEVAIDGECDFCEVAGVVITFEELAEAVESVIYELYLTFEESGAYHEDGESSEALHDVKDIAEDLLLNAVAPDVLAPLAEFIAGRNDVDYGFVRRRDVWGTLYDFDEGDWRHFMAQARAGHFARAAAALVTSLPPDIQTLLSRIVDVAREQGLFRRSAPRVWRCRQGDADSNLRSGQELGSPPVGKAGDGRLNAAGQSVFYGSTSLRGAVIETVNHSHAQVQLWAGQFTASQELFYLDMLEPPLAASPFEPGASDTRDAISFLRRFAQTIREPWKGDPSHYRPTQFFVAYLLSLPEELRPEAIRFASSLDPASENWAIFVDREHCANLGTDAPDACDGPFMLLDAVTVQFVVASDYLKGNHP